MYDNYDKHHLFFVYVYEIPLNSQGESHENIHKFEIYLSLLCHIIPYYPIYPIHIHILCH